MPEDIDEVVCSECGEVVEGKILGGELVARVHFEDFEDAGRDCPGSEIAAVSAQRVQASAYCEAEELESFDFSEARRGRGRKPKFADLQSEDLSLARQEDDPRKLLP